MRIGVLAILFCWLLAGTCPASARTPDAQSSRVENHTQQTWKVSVGSWAAGMIRIREAGSRIELASLKGEGEGYLLEAGKAVEMEILPTKKCLALQVRFAMVAMPSGGVSGASIFVSQGNPGDQHTLNINDSPVVHVDKAFYGKPREGTFVRIN
jgi:hypothetical protein